jgi:hypothetical protein
MLISNLYAEQAQSYNEETKEEFSKILSFHNYIQAVFMRDKKDKFYGPTYEMPAGGQWTWSNRSTLILN